MRTRELGLCSSGILAVVTFLVLACPGRSGAAAEEDLLKLLVEKNEAAWQKIQSLASIQYTVERQWLERQSQQPFQGVAQIKKKGKRLWSTYRFPTHTGPLQVVREEDRKVGGRTMTMKMLEPDTSGGQTTMTEHRLVVNDQYVAQWMSENPLAYRYDHNSVDAISPKMQTRLKMSLPPDFLQSCFGEDRRRFPEAVKTASDRRRYEAVERTEKDGRRLYEIRRFYPTDAQKPDLVSVIDPSKGFLATECVFNAMGDAPVSREKMRVEQIAPGVWYPVAYEETRYAEPNQPGDPPVVSTWSKIAVKNLRINEPISDEQFDIEALGLQKDKPDITVMRVPMNGRMTPYVYREGRLVPRR